LPPDALSPPQPDASPPEGDNPIGLWYHALMLTLDEIRELPRRQRRQAIADYLSELLKSENDVGQVRDAVYQIVEFGSRFRNEIFELARTESTDGEVRTLLEGYVKSVTGRSIDVAVPGDGMQRREITPLLAQLESCRVPRHRCHLTVKFFTPHAAVTALGALAAWASRNARTAEFEYPKRKAQRLQSFFDRAGIATGICDHTGDPYHYDAKGRFGFVRIDPDCSACDELIQRLTTQLGTQLHLTDEFREELDSVCRHLLHNALEHAEIDSPAWLFVSHHPRPASLHIAVSDLGCGMRDALSRSEIDAVADATGDRSKWLELALKSGVSSASEGHAGDGLPSVLAFTRSNDGQVIIISGTAVYQAGARHTSKGESKFEARLTSEKASWPGTLVGLLLPLDERNTTAKPEPRSHATDGPAPAADEDTASRPTDAPGPPAEEPPAGDAVTPTEPSETDDSKE
jgi:hypothetical protein